MSSRQQHVIIQWLLIVLVLCVSIGYQECHYCLALAPKSLSPRTAADSTLHRLDGPTERAALDSFYSLHFSKPNKKRVLPPPLQQHDQVYILRDNNTTIAAVRHVPERNEYVLLRSLCVSKAYRRQGYALKLLNESVDDYFTRHANVQGCFCMADITLKSLYQQAGFRHIETQTTSTPD